MRKPPGFLLFRLPYSLTRNPAVSSEADFWNSVISWGFDPSPMLPVQGLQALPTRASKYRGFAQHPTQRVLVRLLLRLPARWRRCAPGCCRNTRASRCRRRTAPQVPLYCAIKSSRFRWHRTSCPSHRCRKPHPCRLLCHAGPGSNRPSQAPTASARQEQRLTKYSY